MQIVIDIPDKVYGVLKYFEESMGLADKKDDDVKTALIRAVVNGTPLPKGHGRLFDEKEIDTVVNDVFSAFDTYSPETFLNVIRNQCIEAVGAYGAESEDINETCN